MFINSEVKSGVSCCGGLFGYLSCVGVLMCWKFVGILL